MCRKGDREFAGGSTFLGYSASSYQLGQWSVTSLKPSPFPVLLNSHSLAVFLSCVTTERSPN